MYRLTATTRQQTLRAGAFGPTRLLRTAQSERKVENVNMYDARAYSRNRINTRVVVRNKPVVKSWRQKLFDYLKPQMQGGTELLDTLQLLKLLGFLTAPIFILMLWKHMMKKLPDTWEQQIAGLQNRENRESEIEARTVSYFDVIDDLETKRDKALERRAAKKGVAADHLALLQAQGHETHPGIADKVGATGLEASVAQRPAVAR